MGIRRRDGIKFVKHGGSDLIAKGGCTRIMLDFQCKDGRKIAAA